jgi:ankyrin repeat protein
MEEDLYLQIIDSCSRLVNMLENGVNVNIVDSNGMTVLTGLIMNPDLAQKHKYILCLLLLEYGANPNTEKGLSPLMIAVIMGDIKIVELLVTYGADVNYEITCKDPHLFIKDGDTALSIAMNTFIGENDQIALFFINSQKIKKHLLVRSCLKNMKYMRYVLDLIQEFHPQIEQK